MGRPLLLEELGNIINANRIQAMSENNKPSLLIVDDEPDVLFSLVALLRRDFQVFTAESGAQALEVLQQHPIHVIMTDQRMPSMTGVELMSRVRTEFPEAIRIVFTGYADIRAVVFAINTGGLYRYLTKPWDPDELVELLKEAAAKHDELVAQAQLHESLSDYLDDASQLIRVADSSELGVSFAEQFQLKTQRLRNYLSNIQGDS